MSPRKPLLAALVVLALLQGVLHSVVVRPVYNRDFGPRNFGVRQGLDPSMLFLQFFGFREFLAGILWVRADSFFDSGNYDAILPILRLTTWLDPNNLDVYATGMWHLGYNFTDEESRSDRRYIPYALAFGMEGARNNPNIYELFFETGWMWFHKIDDNYDKAVYWFREANKREDIIPARRNLLASALFRNGEIDEALAWYYTVFDDAQKKFEESEEFQNRQIRDTIENNIDTTIVRMVQRGYLASKRNDGSFETGEYDVSPPFNVGFSARVTVEEPRVIRVEGTWNVLPVGTRVRIVLRDADYPRAAFATQEWDWTTDVNLDPPAELTWMQDQLFVRNRRFNKLIDMSRDPTMYPMTKQDYIIEFYYNPRSAPPHIQDKFGYNGEGMTDRNFLSTEARPGQRVMYTSMTISRDQLLRRGQWINETPVLQTPNFVAPRATPGTDQDVIVIPGLRADTPNVPNQPSPGNRTQTGPPPGMIPSPPPGTGVRRPPTEMR